MTTETHTDSPIERLLRELITRDEAREEKEVERAAALKRIEAALVDVKAEAARATGANREVRNELVRQDQQIQLFDQRIHGNYIGIMSRLDAVDEDLKHGNAVIGNVEIAVVDLSRQSRILHGRMIEESDIVGRRLKQAEDGLGAMDTRLVAVELRALEAHEPASVEGAIVKGGRGGG